MKILLLLLLPTTTTKIGTTRTKLSQQEQLPTTQIVLVVKTTTQIQRQYFYVNYSITLFLILLIVVIIIKNNNIQPVQAFDIQLPLNPPTTTTLLFMLYRRFLPVNKFIVQRQQQLQQQQQPYKRSTTIQMMMMSSAAYAIPTPTVEDGNIESSSSQQQQQHETTTTTTTMNTTTSTTKIVKAQRTTNIQLCGQYIQHGRLVAFPTETVYGLGCDAFNPIAIQNIFITKERPYTDPIIVHVLHPYIAYPLWDATTTTTISNGRSNNNIEMTTTPSESITTMSKEGQILHALCTQFWPGPLTIVAKAAIHHPAFSNRTTTNNNTNSNSSNNIDNNLNVLSLLTANTGYIAIRSPRHPIARSILEAAAAVNIDTNNNNNNSNNNNNVVLGIAAPSANKFGHVSPTCANHVYMDLLYEDVLIYDDDNNTNTNNTVDSNNKTEHEQATSISCDVGVESTVVKVETIKEMKVSDPIITYKVTLLRQGAISVQDIELCLLNAGLIKVDESSNSNDNNYNNNNMNDIIVSSNIKRATSEHVSNVAPGQSIRHYSPNIPSYLISQDCISNYLHNNNNSNNDDNNNKNKIAIQDFLSCCVIIDYGQQMKCWKDYCIQYFDLSPECNTQIAAQQLFTILRTAEAIQNVQYILFPQYYNLSTLNSTVTNNTDDDALALALQDRLTRAASGVVLHTLPPPKTTTGIQ